MEKMNWQFAPTPFPPPLSVGKRVMIFWLAELVEILMMFTGYLRKAPVGDLACLSIIYYIR